MSFHNPKSTSEIDRNLPRLQEVPEQSYTQWANANDPYGVVKPANQVPVENTPPLQP